MFEESTDAQIADALRELSGRFSQGWHKGIEIDAADIELLAEAAERLSTGNQS